VIVHRTVEVRLPEEGYVVRWPVVLPMAVLPKYKAGWYRQFWESNKLWRYEDVYKWRVTVNSTLKLWPNSYLIIGVWPNGTVRQWRFVARPALLVERAEPPGNITGILADICEYRRDVCPDGPAYMYIPTLWADEPVPNYNHVIGDRGNGTAVAWIRLAYPSALQIRLYPNGTAMYVATKGLSNYTSPRSYIKSAMRLIASERYGKSYWYGPYPFYVQGYLPEGDYEEFDVMYVDVVNANGKALTVADIVTTRFFQNGTVVVRRYVITNDTGCLGFYLVGTRFRYTHRVTGCTLDRFLVEEFRFDATPLRIPYVCPDCTGPIGFRLYEVRNPRAMYEWFFSAPAPTVLTPLLSYRGDEVASVRYHRLEGGRLAEVGWIGDPRYAVITFAKASEEYYALRAAAQVVDLLIP